MYEYLERLFTFDFMPHGYCYLWFPEVLWLHVISDLMIAVAYFIIPASLLIVAKGRRELPFRRLFWLFGAFIVACGITHLFGIWTIWHATYAVEGLMKLATGLISIATAVILVPLIPKALALRSPAELEELNRDLEAEVEERRQAEERIRRLAHYDQLTGLPNRILLNDRIQQALNRARREGHVVAVALIDLDHFKNINDALGHSFGDALLRVAADRLREATRSSDTVARFGGDEFVMVFGDLPSVDAAIDAARRMQAAVGPELQIEGRSVHVTGSFGLALFPEHGDSPDTLIGNADLALYHAKTARPGISLFAPEMLAAVQERNRIEHELRRAMEDGDLVVHYQPQVDLGTGRITGVEALVRWRGRDGALISPADFIPIAETTGLIRPLGSWVLGEACRATVRWRENGRPLSVAVNVSPVQCTGAELRDEVAAILDETRLPPASLEIELTEGVFMDGDAAEAIEQLTGLGVGLAIDDFGTGFSSLAYLRRIAARCIKIDRDFIRQLGQDREAEAIVRGVIDIAHSLGKQVLAEGVETEAQLDLLRDAGCDLAQGFLFAPPLPEEEIGALLASARRWPAEEPRDAPGPIGGLATSPG